MPNKNNSTEGRYNGLKKLLDKKYDFPFKLLLLLLIFTSFRPDCLIPGGKFLKYLPTLLIALLFLKWFQAPKKILNNLQTKYLFAFFMLMVIQIPFSRNPFWTFSLDKSFFLYTIPIYLFPVQFINTSFKVERYVKLTVALGLFFALIGITGQGLVSIPMLRDENDFCLWMNILFGLSYFLGQDATEKRKIIFWYSCSAVFILANIASFSRGGFVGLIAVGLFIVYKSKKKVLALVLVALFALLMYLFAPPTYWNEMETIQTQKADTGTGRQRIESWKAGWRMFLDHPIIGVGANNYGIWLADYFPFKAHTMWGRVAHSLYFTLLPEMGIIGTLLFCGMLYGNYRNHIYLYQLKKKKNKLFVGTNLKKDVDEALSKKITTLYNFSLAYSAGFFAYLVTGTFISVLWYSYFWMFMSFWVMTANVGKEIEIKLQALQLNTPLRSPH